MVLTTQFVQFSRMMATLFIMTTLVVSPTEADALVSAQQAARQAGPAARVVLRGGTYFLAERFAPGHRIPATIPA